MKCPKIAFTLLCLVALSPAVAKETAARSTFKRFQIAGTPAPVYYYAPHRIEDGSRCETAAVIIHGWGGGCRLTGDVEPFAVALANAVGPSNVAPYVVSPLFPRRRILVKSGIKDDGRAVWNDSWGRDLAVHGVPDDDWRGGGDAAGVKLSSFEVVDSILLALGDKNRYPALKRVLVTGFSAGGQFVGRYVAVGKGFVREGVEVRYAAMAPSTELRLDDDVIWHYGLKGRPRYSAQMTREQILKNLSSRRVWRACGTKDVLGKSLDVCPEAMKQGENRYARFRSLEAYLKQFPAWERQVSFHAIEGVGHASSVAHTEKVFIDYALGRSAVAETLPPGGWVPAVRERVNALIERNRGNPDAYAVFDFDYTTAIGDLSYACMWRLLETFDFKTDDFRTLFAEGLPPGYEEEVGTICTLATKLKSFAGSDLTGRPEWREFIMRYWTFYRRLFVAVGDYRAYLWRSRMFAGHTPDELRALATDTVRQNLAKGHLYRPSYMPKEKRGLAIPQEMKDLFRALRQAGIAVYIVSGSFQETLWAATGPDFGLDIDPSCVFGADFKKDAAGRYLPEMVEGCVKSGEKPAFIRAHIAPRHHGAEPVLTAGDSMGDYTMLTEFKNLQLALVFMRNWREKKMYELAASGGKVVAQGRDESRGIFIPEPKCIEPVEE